MICESPKAEVNSNVSHQLEQSYAQLEPSSSSSVLQESSIESGSVTSSASHIKVKKTRFPKESFYISQLCKYKHNSVPIMTILIKENIFQFL